MSETKGETMKSLLALLFTIIGLTPSLYANTEMECRTLNKNTFQQFNFQLTQEFDDDTVLLSIPKIEVEDLNLEVDKVKSGQLTTIYNSEAVLNEYGESLYISIILSNEPNTDLELCERNEYYGVISFYKDSEYICCKKSFF